MIIRQATKTDKTELLKLVVYLQNYMRSKEPNVLDTGENIDTKFLKNLLHETLSNSGKIFVAEVEGKIVGFVSGRVEDTTDEIELIEKKFFYISNLAVFPNYQKKGVGSALLIKIEKYAKSIGVKLIQINVLNSNDIAHKTYLKHGFRDYEIVLLKETN